MVEVFSTVCTETHPEIRDGVQGVYLGKVTSRSSDSWVGRQSREVKEARRYTNKQITDASAGSQPCWGETLQICPNWKLRDLGDFSNKSHLWSTGGALLPRALIPWHVQPAQHGAENIPEAIDISYKVTSNSDKELAGQTGCRGSMEGHWRVCHSDQSTLTHRLRVEQI